MIPAADLHYPQARESHESQQAVCQMAGHLCATSVLKSSSVKVSIALIPYAGG